jgi:hypothetical protein
MKIVSNMLPARATKTFSQMDWGECFQMTPDQGDVYMKQNDVKCIHLGSATMLPMQSGDRVYPVDAVCHFTPLYEE